MRRRRAADARGDLKRCLAPERAMTRRLSAKAPHHASDVTRRDGPGDRRTGGRGYVVAGHSLAGIARQVPSMNSRSNRST
jgi:hypothetical protein